MITKKDKNLDGETNVWEKLSKILLTLLILNTVLWGSLLWANEQNLYTTVVGFGQEILPAPGTNPPPGGGGVVLIPPPSQTQTQIATEEVPGTQQSTEQNPEPGVGQTQQPGQSQEVGQNTQEGQGGREQPPRRPVPRPQNVPSGSGITQSQQNQAGEVGKTEENPLILPENTEESTQEGTKEETHGVADYLSFKSFVVQDVPYVEIFLSFGLLTCFGLWKIRKYKK